MKLSDQLARDHESGDFGNALRGYSDRAAELEQQLDNAVQMLSDQDFEYNRKTNDLIERHAQQLAERDAEILRLRGEVFKRNAGILDAQKQNVMLRDALQQVVDIKAFRVTTRLCKEALDATANLAGLILCDAKSAIWLSKDGQDFSYQQSARFTTPRYEAKEKA